MHASSTDHAARAPPTARWNVSERTDGTAASAGVDILLLPGTGSHLPTVLVLHTCDTLVAPASVGALLAQLALGPSSVPARRPNARRSPDRRRRRRRRGAGEWGRGGEGWGGGGGGPLLTEQLI